MNRLHLVAIFFAFACVQYIYGAPSVKDDDDDDEGTYQIIAGNCTTAMAADMVFHDHVHKSYIPLIKRNATSSWYGDQKIYCLEVLNEKDESKGGSAFVKEGGIGHNFVTVEMHSLKGHGLEFDVQVYAK